MKKGLQSMVNASTKIASGSGCHETNLGNCVFIRAANKSISGRPQCSTILAKIVLSRVHSVLSLNSRDSSSALVCYTSYMSGSKPDIFDDAPRPNLVSNIIASRGLCPSHRVDISYCCGIIRFNFDMLALKA